MTDCIYKQTMLLIRQTFSSLFFLFFFISCHYYSYQYCYVHSSFRDWLLLFPTIKYICIKISTSRCRLKFHVVSTHGWSRQRNQCHSSFFARYGLCLQSRTALPYLYLPHLVMSRLLKSSLVLFRFISLSVKKQKSKIKYAPFHHVYKNERRYWFTSLMWKWQDIFEQLDIFNFKCSYI